MTENGTGTEGQILLAPHERERLLGLLRHADALGIAYDGAYEEFVAYRRELGIPDRPSRNPA